MKEVRRPHTGETVSEKPLCVSAESHYVARERAESGGPASQINTPIFSQNIKDAIFDLPNKRCDDVYAECQDSRFYFRRF